ncbi:MAG: heavy metal-responsive transcriptional regulator [Acidobacteria bacterium]|nr:heavy metal-responsive transcriptional regulator [Acidobacteriota bacterium]
MAKANFIGVVARATGVSIHTVRYYERLGLLPPPQRTQSGYRVYGHTAEERLHFIRQAQALGFSLAEIKEIVRLKYSRQSPCNCVRGLLKQKLKQVERQMKELAQFRRALEAALNRSERLPRLPHTASGICPIIETAGASRQSRSG